MKITLPPLPQTDYYWSTYSSDTRFAVYSANKMEAFGTAAVEADRASREQVASVDICYMTLRDHFAGQVMPALLADNAVGNAALFAYEIADAMMKARAL